MNIIKAPNYKLLADFILILFYGAAFLLVRKYVTNDLYKFYAFLIAIIFISGLFGFIYLITNFLPIFNNYLSILLAAIGLSLLVHVTEQERMKVDLLHLHGPIMRQLYAAERNMELFSVMTEHRDSIKDELIKESLKLPSQYEVTKTECVTMPRHELLSFDVFDINARAFRRDVPMLDQFVSDIHCSEVATTLNRKRLNDGMPLSEIIKHSSLHSRVHEVNGKVYSLSSLLTYADYVPHSEEWNNKNKKLEAALSTAKQSRENLEDQYYKVGSDINVDVQDKNWQVKSFYFSSWNFFLIIALGYQLNSTIIRRH